MKNNSKRIVIEILLVILSCLALFGYYKINQFLDSDASRFLDLKYMALRIWARPFGLLLVTFSFSLLLSFVKECKVLRVAGLIVIIGVGLLFKPFIATVLPFIIPYAIFTGIYLKEMVCYLLGKVSG